MKTFKPVIGLEIHVALKTQSKMFCGCKNDSFGAKQPNTYVCPVCLGMPGALPVPNKKAIDWTILIGKALNCKINEVSKFDRKHYFYPDLPKGYQISQYDEPIASNGWLKLKFKSDPFDKTEAFGSEAQARRGHPERSRTDEKLKVEEKKFRVRRVHLEEDTGKLIHSGSDTLVDFNRSGVPLVEVVTEPDFDNADDVKRFLEELQVIIRYLGVSDADMEKGSMRLEPNISVAVIPAKAGIQKKNWIPDQVGDDKVFKLPSYKVEIKNINSFRFVKQAIEYEVERQIEILEKGETPMQETRGFDEKKVVTYGQRSKEEAHDYRYFPEPDIPPMTFSKKFIGEVKVPELPQEKMNRYIVDLDIKEMNAFQLTRDKLLSDYFEKVYEKLKIKNEKLKLKVKNLPQTVANYIINKKLPTGLDTEEFAKKALELLIPKETDEKVLDISIKHLIEINKKAVEDYKKGKENAIMFLVGQVMREMKGKADVKLIISKLKAQISKPNLKT